MCLPIDDHSWYLPMLQFANFKVLAWYGSVELA